MKRKQNDIKCQNAKDNCTNTITSLVTGRHIYQHIKLDYCMILRNNDTEQNQPNMHETALLESGLQWPATDEIPTKRHL